MPNRLLKEGIVDSEKINSLTAQAEVFFYRLLVVSDDFGRMDGRSAILKAKCFPLKEFTSRDIEDFLFQLETAKLVFTYKVNDMPYIQILNWSQRQRSHGKYPPPLDCHLTDISKTIDGVGLGLGLGLGRVRDKGLGLGDGGHLTDNGQSDHKSLFDKKSKNPHAGKIEKIRSGVKA